MTDRLSSNLSDGTAAQNLTERLYYRDSFLFSFEAVILSCVPSEKKKGCFEIILDRTAFFPEGGGQTADTGMIGNARVIDVQDRHGVIVHYTDTAVTNDGAIRGIGTQDRRHIVIDHNTGAVVSESGADPLGQDNACIPVFCAVDREQRLRRMQNHSGEHVVSGLVNSAYGYDNVGFHMGDVCMTIDFSGELTWEQLKEIEQRANEVVRSDLPVTAYFPDAETLKELNYRSKLELTENVRIVEIGGNGQNGQNSGSGIIDRCACCAPHVARTGQIGIIKILSCVRHRGGVRIELVCGMDALDDYRRRQDSVTEISELLSAKRNEVSSAVEHLKAERDQLKFTCAGLETELVTLLADRYPEQTEGNIIVFRNFSEPAARELVNRLKEKCTGMAAVFFGKTENISPDNNSTPYRYIIGSSTVDVRAKAKEINAAISGRGGGKPEMITGSSAADKETIEAYFR